MAEYRAACPGCKVTIRFKKPRAEITCPRCKTHFAVPNQAAAQSPASQQSVPRAQAPAAQAPPPKRANPQPQLEPVLEPLQELAEPVALQNADPLGAAGLQQTAPLNPAAATPNPFADQNPYQSPMTPEAHGVTNKAAPSGGIWREGNVLVMHKNAVLPDICLKSNQPANQRIKLNYSWHNPIIALTILIGVLIYVILAIVLSKKAAIDIPLTSQWVKKRRLRIVMTWLLSFACLSCIFLGIAVLSYESETIGALLMLSSLVLFFVAIIFGSAMATLFKPTKITDTHVWLKGVNREFLNTLPTWTGY